MTTILIAEDDENIRLLLERQLNKSYVVLLACNGLEALEVLGKNRVDLVITDIMMPGMDGFELVKNIRSVYPVMPILMLTANLTFEYKKTGFQSGTDDYLTKPFDKEELLWRITALLRRVQIDISQTVTTGNIKADHTTYTISNGITEKSLPKKEFELLYKFLSNPGRIFTKNQLLDDIWGFDTDSSEETIKTHISRLRNKIKDFKEISIVAVKGLGYKMENYND